jgi:hypothetical protein
VANAFIRVLRALGIRQPACTIAPTFLLPADANKQHASRLSPRLRRGSTRSMPSGIPLRVSPQAQRVCRRESRRRSHLWRHECQRPSPCRRRLRITQLPRRPRLHRPARPDHSQLILQSKQPRASQRMRLGQRTPLLERRMTLLQRHRYISRHVQSLQLGTKRHMSLLLRLQPGHMSLLLRRPFHPIG